MNETNHSHRRWLESLAMVVTANKSHSTRMAEDLSKEIEWRESNRREAEVAGHRFTPSELKKFTTEIKRLQQIRLDHLRVVEATSAYLEAINNSFGLTGTLEADREEEKAA